MSRMRKASGGAGCAVKFNEYPRIKKEVNVYPLQINSITKTCERYKLVIKHTTVNTDHFYSAINAWLIKTVVVTAQSLERNDVFFL